MKNGTRGIKYRISEYYRRLDILCIENTRRSPRTKIYVSLGEYTNRVKFHRIKRVINVVKRLN